MKPAILLLTAFVLSIPVIILSKNTTETKSNKIIVQQNSNFDFIQKIDLARLR